jgi:transcriptional regulator with XRE-family HTH domain
MKTSLYSRQSRDALQLLATLIQVGRKEKKWTVQALADRAGISRGTMQRIEKGDRGCEIGTVLEVAAIVGIPLFEQEHQSLLKQITVLHDKAVFLPKKIKKQAEDVDDRF